MRPYKLAILFMLILSSGAAAQVSQTAVQFLLIAPGARAGGMGETFVAVSDDATAVHWNPAGLGRYPLTGSWLEYKTAREDTVDATVLVKNNLPEVNFNQYDIWGLVDGNLGRWDGEKWVFGTSQILGEGSSLESLVLRYTGLPEEAAAGYIDRLSRSNNEITPESIDSMQAAITEVLPEDYPYKEDLDYGFEKLHRAYSRLRINTKGYLLIKADIDKAVVSSPLDRETLDKLTFGFDRAISSKGDRRVWIPYNLILPEKINCLGSDDEFVYIGADGGLFKFDPAKFRWSSFTAENDSLPSNNVTVVAKVGRRLMYIGTDKGVVSFTGRQVKKFPAESNVPVGFISSIAATGDRDAWIVSDNNLYHYDGSGWFSSKEDEISIGENLGTTVKKFYGQFGQAWYDRIMGQIAAANGNSIDTVEEGRIIHLPYNLGFKGEITDIGVDPRGDLWLGTTKGIVYLGNEGFRQFGYKLYTVTEEGATAEEVAGQYIPDKNPAKVEKLAELITEFNGLESEQFAPGAEVLVYANSLGSEIYAVNPVSAGKALIATSYGVVEYDKGKWSRMHNLGLSDAKISDIYERDGEMWFSSDDKVTVYAAAQKQITFMHSNYLVQLADDLYYDYFSFVYPTSEWGTFGLGITFLSYGKQERTDEFGNSLGSFFSYDMAMTLSYGTQLAKDISGGVSLRYINSHLAEVGAGSERGKGTGYSLAVDAGILYDLSHRLTLAATVTNLGPDIAYIDADQADPLPRKLAFGFNYKLVDSPFNKVLILGEADKLLVDLNDDITTELEEIIPHIGLEYWYSNYVSLRTGYVYDDKGVQRYLTLGASLQYTNYRFDFSYIPASNEKYNRLGNTMRFSMNVGF